MKNNKQIDKRPRRASPSEQDYYLDRATNRHYSEKSNQPKRRLPIFKIIIAVLLAAVLFIAADFVYLLSSYKYDSTDKNKLAFDSNGIATIALFGVDTREGNAESGTRSDAMMIMSVDSKRGKIKLVSLMRDSYVNVPGYGMTKLCHAYSYGGPELAIQTINELYNMDIKEYMTVDFGQMASIIDSVGGVKIDVTKAERIETNKFIREYCKANNLSYKKNKIKKSGKQKLNGIQAMTYGRIRKGNTGGDWSRTERQSMVLEQVFAKASGNPITLMRFANGLVPNITTTLSKQDFMSMGFKGISHGMPKMEHIRLPLDGEWQYGTGAGGMSVITFDDAVLAKHLHEYIYDDITPKAN